MRKNELHIEIKIDTPKVALPNDEELSRNVAAASSAFREFGVSVAAAGVAAANMRAAFPLGVPDDIIEVAQRVAAESNRAAFWQNALNDALWGFALALEKAERKAQQRAQLVLLLAFILLTLLVSLL